MSTDSTGPPSSGEDARPGVSPVAESPAREAAANLAEGVASLLGPSPLANVVVTDPTPEATPAQAPALELGISTSPEQMQSNADLPSQAPVTTPEPFGFSDPILPTAAPKPTVVENVEAIPQDAPVVPESVPLPEPTPEVPLSPPTIEPEEPKAIEDHRQDYFSYGDPVIAAAPTATEPVPERAPAVANVVTSSPESQPIPTIPAEDPYRAPDASYVHVPADLATSAWGEEPARKGGASRASSPEPVRRSLDAAQPGASGKLSSNGSKSSMASSFGQLLPDKRGRSRSGSVR